MCFCFLLFAMLFVQGVAGPSRAQAQAPPVEWGEVPRADLEMQAYPADTNATAVVLSDYGEVSFRYNGEMKLERHTRIKILSTAGYDHATVEVPFYAEGRLEDVDDIEGHTFTLSSGGEVERHDLDPDDVFEEKVNEEYRRKRFTLPALQPGVVIEYRYEKTSENVHVLPTWAFQHGEPTRHSEYRLEVPHRLNYVFVTQEVQHFDVRDEARMRDKMRYRWVMKDLPALREEPFMTTTSDFRTQMEFQLKSYTLPRGGTETFIESWQAVADELMDHDQFGDQVGGHGEVRHRAEALTERVKDPAEKMRIIYDFVRRNVRFNGKMGVFAGRDLDDVLEARTGSSPEVALLLVSMLQDAGLKAHPVLISTRSNGRVKRSYPLVNQFNKVVARVEAGTAETGTETHLLDATDPLRPAALLPTGALKRQGLLVRAQDEGGVEWVESGTGGAGLSRSVLVRGALRPDGTLEGTLDVVDEAYSALARRRRLEETDDPEALVRGEMLDGVSEVQLHDVRVQQRHETAKPLRTKAGFTAPAYAQAAGDFLYVNPMVMDRYDENPLRAPERSFPVDMAYPRHLSYTLMLDLPEGYVVHDAPESQRVRLTKNSHFERILHVKEGQLVIRGRLRLAETTFASADYDALRDFFDRLVAAHAEQVVLKRVIDGEEASGG